MKVIRIILAAFLIVLVMLTIIFLADSCIFHPHQKGMSLRDMRDILIFILLPLIILILIVRSIQKRQQ